MKSKEMGVLSLAAMVTLTCLAITSIASADELWGVTMDMNSWSGGEIFTVDTKTGSVEIKNFYDSGTYGYGFGDIARNSAGDVYVTMHNYGGNWDFVTLAKVNTTDWSFDWTYSALPVQMNALTFVGDDLYMHAGGGAVDGLYKLAAADLNGMTAPTLIDDSGYLGSDGGLAYDSGNDKMYNVFTPGSVGNLAEIDYVNGGATLVGTLDGSAKFGTTDGGDDYGWGGLEFDSQGKLWAGSWQDEILYSRPDVNAGSDVVVEYDLSSVLSGRITGLSRAVGGWVEAPAGSDDWVLAGTDGGALTIPAAASGNAVSIYASGVATVGTAGAPSTDNAAIAVQASGYTVTNNGEINFSSNASPANGAAAVLFEDASGNLIAGTAELGADSSINVTAGPDSTTRHAGILAGNLTINNGLNGDITTTGNGNGDAYGIRTNVESGVADVINGGISGDIAVTNSGGTWAVGIHSRLSSLQVNGDVSGTISAETGALAATAVYGGHGVYIESLSGTLEAESQGQTIGIQIWGYISELNDLTIDHITSTGRITTVGGDEFYGVAGLNASANGNVTVGQMDGLIYAETNRPDGSVYGIKAIGRNDDGLDTSLGGNVDITVGETGVIDVRGGSNAYGIMGYNGIDATIRGTLSAQANLGGQSYAIYAGKDGRFDLGDDYDWGIADDTVVLDGATVIGDIDLTGGSNTIALTGNGQMLGDIQASTGTDSFGNEQVGTLAATFGDGATSGHVWDITGSLAADDVTVHTGTTVDMHNMTATSSMSVSGSVAARQLDLSGNANAAINAGGGMTLTSGLLMDGSTSLQLDGMLNTASMPINLSGGSITGTGELVCGSNGVDLGSGTLAGTSGTEALTVFGTIKGSGSSYFLKHYGDFSLGNSPGHVTLGGYENDTSSTIWMELAGADNSAYLASGNLADLQYDYFTLVAASTFHGTLDVSLIDGFMPSNGDSFMLFENMEYFNGGFDTINLPTLADGLAWDTSTFYDDGTFTVTPEPATMSLLGLGGLAMLRRRRRRRNRK
jgi:hypothetical protein